MERIEAYFRCLGESGWSAAALNHWRWCCCCCCRCCCCGTALFDGLPLTIYAILPIGQCTRSTGSVTWIGVVVRPSVVSLWLLQLRKWIDFWIRINFIVQVLSLMWDSDFLISNWIENSDITEPVFRLENSENLQSTMMASSVRVMRGRKPRLDERLMQLNRVTIAKTKIEIHFWLVNILLQLRYEYEMITSNLRENDDYDGHSHNSTSLWLLLSLRLIILKYACSTVLN